jgi:hypothetical protein
VRLKPVKRCAPPRFPTRAILDAHPELLRLVPKRWQGNALVLGAVAAALEISREELRRQVRDFVAWLKAQGVI